MSVTSKGLILSSRPILNDLQVERPPPCLPSFTIVPSMGCIPKFVRRTLLSTRHLTTFLIFPSLCM